MNNHGNLLEAAKDRALRHKWIVYLIIAGGGVVWLGQVLEAGHKVWCTVFECSGQNEIEDQVAEAGTLTVPSAAQVEPERELSEPSKAEHKQVPAHAANSVVGPQQEVPDRKQSEANYSAEFRKYGSQVQDAVNDKNWVEVLNALPQLVALPNSTVDDLKAIATWRLQATQALGYQDEFAAAIESFLAQGFADPESFGPMHRQLAAHYSTKKDGAKTLEHFQQFVDSTPDVAADDLETLGRLHLQARNSAMACMYFGEAIDLAKHNNEKPKEQWFQLRDRCFVELEAVADRLANLEELQSEYPNPEYSSRIDAMNQARSQKAVDLVAAKKVIVQPPTLRTRNELASALIAACYPLQSRRLGEIGLAKAVVQIDATGKAVSWRLIESSGSPRLDEAAVDCVVPKLEFVAGRRNGQPVAAEVSVPVGFKLE